MTNLKYILFTLLVVFIATSCSTIYIIGEDFNADKVSEIKIGETNMQEVITMFGDPIQKGVVDSTIVFIYQYEENEFPFNPNPIEVIIIRTTKTLYIYFDENRVVKHFTYNVPAAPGSLDLVIVAERNRRKQQSQNNDQLNNNHMTPGNFRTGF